MSGNDGEGREEGRQAEIGLKYRSRMEGGHGWAGEGGLIRGRWGGGRSIHGRLVGLLNEGRRNVRVGG
jgi:hypothetical protein